MEMLEIHSCLAALIVAIAVFRRKNSFTRIAFVLLILTIQAWLSIHYLAAYREIGIHPANEIQPGQNAWFMGVCAMNKYTVKTYIPIFMIYAVALGLLTIISEVVRPHNQDTPSLRQ
jgi:hypothetical protein